MFISDFLTLSFMGIIVLVNLLNYPVIVRLVILIQVQGYNKGVRGSVFFYVQAHKVMGKATPNRKPTLLFLSCMELCMEISGTCFDSYLRGES